MNNSFFINIKNKGEKIELKGWVNKSRRMGELVFFDLRNGIDIIQVVVESDSNAFEIANSLRSEFVVSVLGKVVERKNKNSNLHTGEIEIKATEISIINKSKQTPMIIRDETDALEQKRLEYRYLDLRRPMNQKILRIRSEFNKIIRDYFYNNKFIEIETPIITKPTLGGAGELKVLSENHDGKYYSLVQSPQVYKQLLMYGGIEKYFQIARCFRDEDSRSDRQLEFTQLDIELAFTSESEIMNYINGLLKIITNKFKGVNITEIPIISYEDALDKYGSDKPDIRFENLIYDLTDELRNTKINFISQGISDNKNVKALFFEGDLSNSEIKKMEETIKSQGSSSFVWSKFNNDLITGSLKSLNLEEVNLIKTKLNIKNNGILFMIIDTKFNSLEFIGRIRLLVAKKLNLIDDDKLSFLWVNKFPLFEKNSEGNIESMHNPFTSVLEEDLIKFRNATKDSNELLDLYSNAYDIVLNGTEIGGGSIRFSNISDQNKAFELIGLSEQEVESNFGWFLEAQKYGIPQHGGVALGLDRILSILFKKESIRDVIAFPKSTSGSDEMMKAPIELK